MPSERFTSLAAVLGGIRSDEGVTQPQLVDRVGLGRSVVAQRVAELVTAGLIESDGLGPSTGGRAPRRLRIRRDAGHVLGVDIAANEISVAIADLSGFVVETRREPARVSDGPDVAFKTIDRMVTSLLTDTGTLETLWTVGVGMPGPVVSDDPARTTLPTMPAWNSFPPSDRLEDLWRAPVWMESRVILSAIGERRVNPVAAASAQTLYLGGGEELGAAFVVNGRVYRGARGLAGEIAHLPVPDAANVQCWCGSRRCLEAVVGHAALVRDGQLLADFGQSPMLAAKLAANGEILPRDITEAAEGGDLAARALLERNGRFLGATMATLVSALNPDLVILGGGLQRASAFLLDAFREAIHSRVRPCVIHGLRIEPSTVDLTAGGLAGAVQFAVDGIFTADELARWMRRGAPYGSRDQSA